MLYRERERGSNDCSEYREGAMQTTLFSLVRKYDVYDDDDGNGSSGLPTEMCVCVSASSWKGLFILSWLYDGS